jgi:CRISPR-associated endonuclease Cas1
VQFDDTLYGVVKNRTLVLSGYVMSLSVELGCLKIRDGIKGAVVERSFARAGCPFSRLISTQSEGAVSLAALRWLDAGGIPFALLAYDGKPIVVSAPQPTAGVDASCRRRQALLSHETGLGKTLAFTLIDTKIAGQIAVLESGVCLGGDRLSVAVEIAKECRNRLTLAKRSKSSISHEDITSLEGMASGAYWSELAAAPISFLRQAAVPAHWRTLGPRSSPLAYTPRHAATPGQALLNYVYGVAISEVTIALHAAGLDPALGVLHADKIGRSSLAYDLIEPIRPLIDQWLLSWVASTAFAKRDFFEDEETDGESVRGRVSIMRPLPSHLAMTVAMWRKLAVIMVDWFYGALQSGEVNPLRIDFNTFQRARWNLGQRPVPSTCYECGKILPATRRKFCSRDCYFTWRQDPNTGRRVQITRRPRSRW